MVTDSPICTVLSSVFPLKCVPTALVLYSSVTILSQSKNAKSPILMTDSGMVMDFKALHPLNASSPTFVTELGITIDTRLLHFSNADLLMPTTLYVLPAVTVAGIVIQGISTC